MKTSIDASGADRDVDKLSEGPNSYALIATKLGIPTTAVVYYPCCGNDKYPQDGFPQNRFIYADGDVNAIAALQGTGKEAYCQDVRTFDPVPGGVDVLVVQNPMLSSLEFVDRVKTDGVIICNDYHASAKTLMHEPSVALVAIVHNPRSAAPEWNDAHTQDCFEYANTTADLLVAGRLAYCEKMLNRYGADIEGDNVATKYQILYKRYFDSEAGFAIIGNPAEGGMFLDSPPMRRNLAPDDIAVFRKKLVTPEQKEARIEAAIEELAAVLPEPLEAWTATSLEHAMGISLVVDSGESLLATLRQNALNLMQLHALQGITEYFSLREYWKLKFQNLTADQRLSFKFNLEVSSAVVGDPAFNVALPEGDTSGADFFGSDDIVQTE